MSAIERAEHTKKEIEPIMENIDYLEIVKSSITLCNEYTGKLEVMKRLGGFDKTVIYVHKKARNVLFDNIIKFLEEHNARHLIKVRRNRWIDIK